MKTFFFIIILLVTSVQEARSQTGRITKSVVAELEYFDEFLSKFLPEASNHLFVMRIDTSFGQGRGNEILFLISTIYNHHILEYINPEYAFFYKGNWYVIKTNIKLEGDIVTNILPYSEFKGEINEYMTEMFSKNPLYYSVAFRFCFEFKTLNGKVNGGMNIGSCEPYINFSNDDLFFYNNSDIERVEGKKD